MGLDYGCRNKLWLESVRKGGLISWTIVLGDHVGLLDVFPEDFVGKRVASSRRATREHVTVPGSCSWIHASLEAVGEDWVVRTCSYGWLLKSWVDGLILGVFLEETVFWLVNEMSEPLGNDWAFGIDLMGSWSWALLLNVDIVLRSLLIIVITMTMIVHHQAWYLCTRVKTTIRVFLNTLQVRLGARHLNSFICIQHFSGKILRALTQKLCSQVITCLYLLPELILFHLGKSCFLSKLCLEAFEIVWKLCSYTSLRRVSKKVLDFGTSGIILFWDAGKLICLITYSFSLK